MPPLQTVAVTLQRKIPNLGILSCSAAINLRVKRPVNSGKQAARSMKNLLNNCLIGTVLAIAAVGPWRVSGIVTAQEAAEHLALPTDVSGQTVFLFSYFTGNGESGLHLAWSTDGLRWEALAGGRPLVRPEVGGRLMRDPCITQGPDGKFHMVWTTQWNDLGFGLSHSADLIHWSPQEFVPIMAQVPGARNCWAPELVWDPATEQWVIFWSSTVEGRFPETLAAGDPPFWNHRIYRTTTRDFQSYAAVELFYEPGFNVIDATITAFDSRYVMVMKNETRYPPAKNLCVAFAEKILGPWSAPSAPFSPQGVWVEGPTVLRVGEWYYVYFDRYIERTYGVMRTKDFQTFEDLSDRLRYPAGMRHGTAFPVPQRIFQALKDYCDRLEKTTSAQKG